MKTMDAKERKARLLRIQKALDAILDIAVLGADDRYRETLKKLREDESLYID